MTTTRTKLEILCDNLQQLSPIAKKVREMNVRAKEEKHIAKLEDLAEHLLTSNPWKYRYNANCARSREVAYAEVVQDARKILCKEYPNEG